MTIHARVRPTWPLLVSGSAGIDVTRASGRATISNNYGALALLDVNAMADLVDVFIPAWDSVEDEYFRISAEDIANVIQDAVVELTGMSDGTVALPGLPFTADLNTGFHRPAADTLSIIAGAVRVFSVTADGVAIGTHSPGVFDDFVSIRKDQDTSTGVNIRNLDNGPDSQSFTHWYSGNPISATGNTNSTAVITGLSINTSLLQVGMRVIGAGIPAYPSTTAYIQSIDGPTQITLTQNATATAVGVALQFPTGADIRINTGVMTGDTGGIANFTASTGPTGMSFIQLSNYPMSFYVNGRICVQYVPLTVGTQFLFENKSEGNIPGIAAANQLVVSNPLDDVLASSLINISADVASLVATVYSSLAAGLNANLITLIAQNNSGGFGIINASNTDMVLYTNNSLAWTIKANHDVVGAATTESSSKATGGLVLLGGLGVAKNVTAETFTAASTTASTSKITGSAILAGGLGVAKDIYSVNVSVDTAYKVAGTQVLSARNTGWTAMTGTPDESTVYDTGSVTLPQLAGRVAALQVALTTHGAIGA